MKFLEKSAKLAKKGNAASLSRVGAVSRGKSQNSKLSLLSGQSFREPAFFFTINVCCTMKMLKYFSSLKTVDKTFKCSIIDSFTYMFNAHKVIFVLIVLLRPRIY